MPVRIDQVWITLSRGIVLGWPAHDALLDQLTHQEVGRPIRDVFEAVGASRPVELTLEQKMRLLEVIEVWANRTLGGFTNLPEGIFELHNALRADLAYTSRWQQT